MLTSPPNMPAPPGTVYLVGAGPGDPGLLTLRGRQCLERADVVLYDYLANPLILAHAGKAELISLGRHGRDRILPQEEINRLMVERALAGQVVVRLKGGDPAVFARAGEELEALAAAGVPFEMVPGVTAAIAAASYTGIPITHRDQASAVALITGRERDDKPASDLDFDALAKFPGTLVFYMGVTTAKEWTAALIAAGKPADTPVAIVRRCSWPDQQTITTTLGEVNSVIEARRLRPPAITIVGPVTRLGLDYDWFTHRPLSGVSVLVARPLAQIAPVRAQLAELGAEVLSAPAIEITDPADWQPVDAALARVADFDWLVFSSANGVERLLNRLLIKSDLRALAHIRIAAIGPGTAEALVRYHLKADLVPKEYRAESLAEDLSMRARGRKFLLARASRGREVLAEELIAAGGQVEQVVVYTSRDIERPPAPIAERMVAGRVDWVLVTSSAIARSLVRMFGDELRRSRLASISPVTSATLRELGFEPAVEAEPYTLPSLVGAIQGWHGKRLET